MIFRQFPEIIFGFSKRHDSDSIPPFHINLSLSVGDDPEKVRHYRKTFYSELGLSEENVVLQKQIHSDICSYVDKGGSAGESDALITDRKGLGLGVSFADCTPVFIYDRRNKVIAGVHSGWRGTRSAIVAKTLTRLKEMYGSDPMFMYCYVGPSISQKNYEVGPEVADQFDPIYSEEVDGKFYLNVKKANYDMLIAYGIPAENIQMSQLCTYENESLLHSYRRDGAAGGRHVGLIALK
ncbi:MAG: peptidoglycan editing factor PgeF [Syntrophothermus sp.]